MRKEFWESRVDGSPEMYISLRSVCEAILSGDSALADAILEVNLFPTYSLTYVYLKIYISHFHSFCHLQASNITTVDATLARCYDERGHEYNIPSYCWSSQGPASMSLSAVTTSFDAAKINANIKNANQPVAIKVQVNPGDRNFVVNANTSNSVAELKALIATESTVVRIIHPTSLFLLIFYCNLTNHFHV